MSVKTITVKQLIDLLKTFDGDMMVAVNVFHSCITDAGTEMGGDEAHGVEGVYDLEKYIVIQPSYEFLSAFKRDKFVS